MRRKRRQGLRRSECKKKKRSGKYSEREKKGGGGWKRVSEGTVGRGGDDDGLAGTRSGSLDTV